MATGKLVQILALMCSDIILSLAHLGYSFKQLNMHACFSVNFCSVCNIHVHKDHDDPILVFPKMNISNIL